MPNLSRLADAELMQLYADLLDAMDHTDDQELIDAQFKYALRVLSEYDTRDHT